MKKLVLGVYNAKTNDYSYGWGKVENINDIYNCIGWLCNISQTEIKITYLEYFNDCFMTFEKWLNKVRKNNNVVAKLNFNCNNYIIKLEEENR